MNVISLPLPIISNWNWLHGRKWPLVLGLGVGEEGLAGGRSFFHIWFLFHVWKAKSRWYPQKCLVVVSRHVDVKPNNTSYKLFLGKSSSYGIFRPCVVNNSEEGRVSSWEPHWLPVFVSRPLQATEIGQYSAEDCDYSAYILLWEMRFIDYSCI